jgi:DNA-binding NarL/FixJ family response regulator
LENESKNRDLTPTGMQALRALSRGMSNKEIGSALDISESTVKAHVTDILKKPNVAAQRRSTLL